jgi:hypothetical protein
MKTKTIKKEVKKNNLLMNLFTTATIYKNLKRKKILLKKEILCENNLL